VTADDIGFLSQKPLCGQTGAYRQPISGSMSGFEFLSYGREAPLARALQPDSADFWSFGIIILLLIFFGMFVTRIGNARPGPAR
jgi:hypothetical protein